MVRQVAGRRCPAAPRSPACPRRLRASRLSAPRVRRSPRQPRSPPAAAAATARCSAPQPSSEPRRRQAAGPAPSHSRQGGGVCAATGGGGQGGCGRLGASGPGARRRDGCHGNGQAPAPRARTRIVSAGSQLLSRRCGAGGLLERCLCLGWPQPQRTAPDFWPLGEDLGGRSSRLCVSGVRIWSHHPSECSALSVALSCKACGRKARTQPRATKIPSTRGSPHPPQGLHVPFGSSCRFVERGGGGRSWSKRQARMEPVRVRRNPSK